MSQLSPFAEATTLDALRAAWRRVETKRSAGGVDGVTVADFARDADAHLARLRDDLLAERYVPEPLLELAIPKGPGKTGTRTLRLPSVRDKIAQEAVRSALEPRLEHQFLDCNYGYRPGRGAGRAIARVTHYLRSMGRRWVAEADIDDFFGSVDQDRLVGQLRPVAQGDGRLLRLVQLWLRMGAVDGRGRWHDVSSGVGQGGVISPLLANLYLHPFDQSLTMQRLGLVRYADDFVILCAEREDAERALARATEFLRERLRLRLNANPTPVRACDDGFTFLGVTFRGGERVLETARVERMTHKLARWTRASPQFDTARSVREIAEAADGWRKYYGTVLAPTQLDAIDVVVRDALTRTLTIAFERRVITSDADARRALAAVRFVRSRPEADLQSAMAEIAQAARAGARTAVRAPVRAVARTPGSTHAPVRAAARPGLPPSPSRETPAPAPTPGRQTPERTAAAARPRRPRPQRGRVGEGVDAAIRRAKRGHMQTRTEASDLIVLTPGHFVGKSGERVVVRCDRRVVWEIPARQLSTVTVAAHGVSVSTDVVTLCAERGVPFVVLGEREAPVAVLAAPMPSDVALGVLQLQAVADTVPAIELGKRFAGGKIRGQLNLMKYVHKYRKRVDDEFASAFARYTADVRTLLRELRGVPAGGDVALARGRVMSVEGRAAAGYWDLVRLAVRTKAAFPSRVGRGATDLVNSMLNYGYAVLQSRVYVAALRAGLTPQVSFLHAPQPGKATLVFDLMEEFRPHVVDRTVLTMLSRQMAAVDGAGRLTSDTRRRFVGLLHARLGTVVRHGGREITLGEIIDVQARAVARHLRAERPYRAYVGRW